MKKGLLPIGSVVLLNGGKKRVMICGRIQAREGEERIYDYTGCFYPEGIMDSKQMFFFDHEAIVRLFFIGFQDPEEFNLQKNISKLGELMLKDGQIVQKDKEENGETQEEKAADDTV